jgi:hypothetical protein
MEFSPRLLWASELHGVGLVGVPEGLGRMLVWCLHGREVTAMTPNHACIPGLHIKDMSVVFAT